MPYYGSYGLMFDPTYLLIIPALILSMYAQFKVNSTFSKYSKIANRKGYTGADVARALLSIAGIYDVRVEHIRGNLTDHYDPVSKVLRLSDSVYNSRSVAALGVAAHETGHAMQHATGYLPLAMRSGIYPLVNISSKLSGILIFVGIIFGLARGVGWILLVGIILFAVVVAFQIITLPVEFNASSRAIKILADNNFLSKDELKPAKKVLSAAALTYVAAAFSAIMSLLRLILIYGRRRN